MLTKYKLYNCKGGMGDGHGRLVWAWAWGQVWGVSTGGGCGVGVEEGVYMVTANGWAGMRNGYGGGGHGSG